MSERSVVLPAEALRRVCAGALLVDVRDADEYASGHIHGARLIPLKELDARAREIPKDRDVLLMCRSGKRSESARQALEDRLGYRNVANVAGGIDAWTAAGLPLERFDAGPVVFEQFYLGCLSHASYLFGANGVGAVVDPQRDVAVYIEAAQRENLEIRYVFETHVHADFVSGHRELAEATGAQIVIGHRAGATYAHIGAREGDVFHVGSLKVQIIETPGHTPEGVCLLIADVVDLAEPVRVLTGDTLFIGDVGRPDLVGSQGYTAEQMAGMLYDSLHGKLLRLDDAVEVYPAHGAGSLCGRSMSDAHSSTIGVQRRENAALQPMTREAFIEMTTTALPEQPDYFALDAEMNRTGMPALADQPQPSMMDAGQVEAAMVSGALLLDVRPSEIYGPRHVPYSMNIGLDGQFAAWAGALIPFTRRIVILAEDDENVAEAVTRLGRIGIGTVDGYLQGGFSTWERAGKKTASIPQMTVEQLHARVEEGAVAQLIDVRRPAEVAAGRIPGAVSIPLSTLESSIERIDPKLPITVICGSGYRSSAAGSILESSGFADITNVDGGMRAYSEHGYPLAEGQPSAHEGG